MKVMFAIFPAVSHLLSFVPYAWALQSAGHEVCVCFPATQDSGITATDFESLVKSTGLTAVPSSCSPESLSIFSGKFPELIPTPEESEDLGRRLLVRPSEIDTWDATYCFALFFIRNFHPPQPREDIDDMIAFAKHWRPDLVVWDPWMPSGAVAARVCGAAHARVLLAPDHTAWLTTRLNAHPELQNPFMLAMQALGERHNIELNENLLFGDVTIDPLPRSMQITNRLSTLPVRCVPHTGANAMPNWLLAPLERPRVSLSLGLTMRHYKDGDWGRTALLLEALSSLDADVIATLGAGQLTDLPGKVPANTHTFDYLPLRHLAPTSSILIHHGSANMFSIATANSIPQVVTDTRERNQFFGKFEGGEVTWKLSGEKSLSATMVADHVIKSGVGLRVDHQAQSVDEIRESISSVLQDPHFANCARSEFNKWRHHPSPTDLVPSLEQLAESR